MLAIKKILIPTDFSPLAMNAFVYALKMADVLEASIKVVHIIPVEYEGTDLPVIAAERMKEKSEVARNLLNDFVEMGFKNSSLKNIKLDDIESEIEIGTPSVRISDMAEESETNLIVSGTKGEHNILEKILGSVSSGLIKKAPCHVLVIPEKSDFKPLNRIAYASDFSDTDPYHIWQLSKMLAPFSTIMHCIHVRTRDQDIQAINMEELKAFFDDRTPHVQIKFHELEGKSVVDTISEFDSLYEIDMLVMHRPHRSLLEGIFHSSVTKKMAFQTKVPMLVIKDES